MAKTTYQGGFQAGDRVKSTRPEGPNLKEIVIYGTVCEWYDLIGRHRGRKAEIFTEPRVRAWQDQKVGYVPWIDDQGHGRFDLAGAGRLDRHEPAAVQATLFSLEEYKRTHHSASHTKGGTDE